MPANNPKTATQVPASPRNTAKYTNKDGSKFITVPKGTPSESSQPTTPTNGHSTPALQPSVSTADGPAARAVNRKKQKRRQKAAAKAAADQTANGHPSPASAAANSDEPETADNEDLVSDDDQEYVLAGEGAAAETNGHGLSEPKSKKNKKKKKKKGAGGAASSEDQPELSSSRHGPSHSSSRGAGMSRDKIWSTNNQEERERIKEFWLGLGEDERKSLVKVEKDAVLKKMKEQQKHTCSCTVCGRKRTAIEEELEGLYDAYYLELEQFANQGEGPPMLPPPRDFPVRPPRRLASGYAGQPPSRGRIVEHVGDEDDEEELEGVYSEDEVEGDEYSDDEPPEDYHTQHDRDVADFLTFGNSLQVKGMQLLDSLLGSYGNMELGGILTVADDLLKNDGKRFIEMMEQLAERRMAREEDARVHFSRYSHPNGSYPAPHDHPPAEEDDYYDEDEEEDDYEDSQDEEDEDEEVYANPSPIRSAFHAEGCCQDQLTEEQRMEEGRRMFQIFAARMFEQRVLSAYKEKVAKERQQKLLEELEEESRQVDEQKAKKAKNAQKKKDKAAQKKQALAEEKARKDAERAAEEADRLALEQKKLDEQRQKAEEKRKQKEAQRRVEEEARLKKEAQRQRRIHEQRERQAEQERKAREAKGREKRLKEEQRVKEKEAREQKEHEAEERKEKQDRDKREKEARAAAKANKEAQVAREAREKARHDKASQRENSQAGQGPAASSAARRGVQHPVSLPAVLPQHPPNPAGYASPKIPVATPAIPRAPIPIRPRTKSQQESGSASTAASRSASVTSQHLSPKPAVPPALAPAPPSSTPAGQQRKSSGNFATVVHPQPPTSTSPHNGLANSPRHSSPTSGPQIGIQQQPVPSLAHQAPLGMGNRMSLEPVYPPGLRPHPSPLMGPLGMSNPRGLGFPPTTAAPPGFAPVTSSDGFPMQQAYAMPHDAPLAQHSRRASGGFEGTAPTMAQPIGRPAPIGRPGSVVQGRSRGADEDTKHLGSRVLVEDDESLTLDPSSSSFDNFRSPPSLRSGFAPSPFMDTAFPITHNPWGPPGGGNHAFAPPSFGGPGWGGPTAAPLFHVGSPHSGMVSMRVSSQPRHVAVRLMLCQAYKELSNSGATDENGFTSLHIVKSKIDAQSCDPGISELDLLNLCDTEGSPSNGGGTFDVKRDGGGAGKHMIRWVSDAGESLTPQHRAVGAPGEIGSPLTGPASLRGN